MVEAPLEGQKQDGIRDIESENQQPTESPKINGYQASSNPKHQGTPSDPDAQNMVISSLRSQIQDLFAQVTELNTKLVKSYDRVSDLEDDLHVASSTVRTSSLRISQLELERTQHLSALNTGLLVEKSHVTAELNRLMEKATEEAAQRGQAESARADIEKDLDDLSASLFGQANSMVAEARYAQHLSEQKVIQAERALKGAEEAVGLMQQQMQTLQADKEKADQDAEAARALMGKGKWIERRDSGSITRPIRLLSSHLPYQEFLLFVAHLRSIHPSSSQPPAMTTLLPLPFLARVLNEDSEPTIRLDLAPSLNWLSRRSVLSAIHNGQLIIEPISPSALIQESPSSISTNIPGLNSNGNNILCALCGTPVFSALETGSRPQTPTLMHANSNSISWSAALFKKSSLPSNTSPAVPPRSRHRTISHSQIHIFRLASPVSAATSIPVPSLPKVIAPGLPSSSSIPPHVDNNSSTVHTPNPSSQPTTIYPLCANGWCLARLRTTCTLWAFIRAGIIEKVWEEEVPVLPPSITPSLNGEKPPIPPRRRGLWGMASALSERATNWSDGDKTKKAVQPQLVQEPAPIQEVKGLPSPPPPIHPTVAAAHAPVRHPVPPPLPKRSEVRHQTGPTTTEVPPKEKGTPLPEAPNLTEPQLPKRPPRRPITPASVPLPDSRPNTPPVITTSPSITPTTPANPTPPPLPRRAAARGPRPMPAGENISRPVTPALNSEAPEAATGLKPEDGTMEGMTHPEPQTDAPKVTDQASQPQSTSGENLTSSVATSTTVADGKLENTASDASAPLVPLAIEPSVDAKTGANVKKDEIDDKGLITETEITQTREENAVDGVQHAANESEAKPEEVKIDKVKHGEGDEHMKGEEEKVMRAAEAKETKVDEAGEIKVDETKGTNSSVGEVKSQTGPTNDETKSDNDKEAYIGDATWEERTWKELVRLKEEMFWARIGGLR